MITFWLSLRLADEVYDAGDHLVFRRGATEHLVYFVDVMNVESQMGSPMRITLNLRKPGPLGDEVVFSPPMQLGWKKPEIVAELIRRVDEARRGHGGAHQSRTDG